MSGSADFPATSGGIANSGLKCGVNLSRLFSAILLILSASLFLTAQDRKGAPARSTASRLISISVTGTKRYTEKEVIAASGLRIGQNASDADFKAATGRLAETGLFTDLAYSYSSSVEGIKLQFQLTDSDQLLPVHFDNIAWFSDEELTEKIRAQVPLFKGQLPVDGTVVGQAADVVEALLVQVNPQVHSTYMRASPNPGDPIDSVIFSVSGTEIRIRNVEYPGASPSQLASLVPASAKIQGSDYHRNSLAQFAKLDLQPVYWKQGYLKVAFADAQARVVSDTPQQTTVDVKIPVIEGQQYKLSTIAWAGNTTFPADKLQSQVQLQPGQVVDAVQLAHDMDQIKASYGSRGYVKATLEPRPEFDDANSSVAYTVQVQEGEQYRMGELDIEGLDAKIQSRLQEDWKLREGEPYDSSYPQRFLKESAPDLPKGVKWNINVYESANDKDKTVDVTVRFSASQGSALAAPSTSGIEQALLKRTKFHTAPVRSGQPAISSTQILVTRTPILESLPFDNLMRQFQP